MFQAFKLCVTEEEELNLSYESLTSEKAKAALEERMKSQEFMDTLFGMEPTGTEDDPETSQDNNVITYDETDSSKTVMEEVADLMNRQAVDELIEDGEVCIGTNLAQFIGHEFTSRNATAAWMKWDAKGSY